MGLNSELAKFIRKQFEHLLPVERKQDKHLLYHYTTLDSLCVMTQKDADFLCTYCAAMNDKAEFTTGLKVLSQLMNQSPDYVDGLTLKTINAICMEPQCTPWSMSFSTNGDSLNQWIAYADKLAGGVAIGFEMEHLYDCINKSRRNSSIMFLAPCLYEESHKTEIKQFFDFLFGFYKNQLFSKIYAKMSMTKDKLRQYISALLALIFASLVKDESFRLEYEWRLVVYPFDNNKVRDCRFISGKPRISAGLFGHDFMLAEAIKRIVCSPHGGACEKVRMIARLRELKTDPESSMSTYTAR